MKTRIIGLFIFALLATTQLTSAQSGWGVMGGLTFNSSGDLVSDIPEIIDAKGSGSSGFNIGLFAKVDLGLLYIKPELLYAQFKTSYSSNGLDAEYKQSQLDLPVLVGLRLIGPLKLFAGPDFQFILNNDLDGFQFDDIANDFTVGGNIGVAFTLGRLEMDLRYQRGFTNNEVSFISENIIDLPKTRVDARTKQLILNLSYRL